MRIIEILHSYLATQCLYVAAKLDIADHLETGNKSIEELSALTKANPDSLYRVMRCLVSLGIFGIDDEKKYALNIAAHELLSDDDNSLKDYAILCGEELYQAAGQLLHTVQTGEPAFKYIHGTPHWEFLNTHPDKARLFHDAMEKGSERILNEIIKNYDFSRFSTIVDVGGGKGHLVCEILSRFPDAEGIVFDLEQAETLSNKYINQNRLSNRCHFMSGNFFESLPTDCGVYLLKVVLHDWDDARALTILRNCRHAMHKNSKLLIIEKIVENGDAGQAALLSDINMLVMYSGKERTVAEFQTLLNSAGLRFVKKIETSTVFSIIEAEIIA